MAESQAQLDFPRTLQPTPLQASVAVADPHHLVGSPQARVERTLDVRTEAPGLCSLQVSLVCL